MNLFEELLQKGKDAVEAARKPFIEKKVQRTFESAIDNANEKIVDQELKLQDLRLKLVTNPENAESILNSIISAKETIRKAERTIEILKSEKEILFSVKA